MNRCITQVVSWGGRRRRCPADATTTRNGQPVCAKHAEPEVPKK